LCGHLASGFIINYLQNFLNKLDFLKEVNANDKNAKNDVKEKIIHDKLKDSNYRILKTSFIKCEYELTQTNFDVNFSGSTAVLLIMISKNIL